MAAKKSSSGRRYGKAAGKSVKRAMKKRKSGTLKSGSGRKVTSRKQAIAIGLSEARESGAKVPRKRAAKKVGARNPAAKKGGARKKSATKRSSAKKGGARKKTAAKKRSARKSGARKKTAKRSR